MPNHLSAAYHQLKRLLRARPATSTQSPYPPIRNFVLDILTEGRRKNTIQLLLEVDAKAIRAQIAKIAAQSGDKISITSYVAGVLARTVAAAPLMHAYLHKGRELVMFADVDLSVMVEREVDGVLLPLPFIVRAANQKSFAQIKNALAQAKSAELYADGPLSALESTFFSLPRALRRIVWYFARRDAHLFRELAGTVGITSMGMHATGRAIVIPITPMTLTLSIGTIYAHPAIREGVLIEQESLQLNLSADHDIIDGAPLMRFAAAFQENLERGMA
ncbi:MAG: 2-oxo acid dehydrogenase subunit E2 [Betaproteobacteria bacterium]